jgi:hypothetical protein
MEWFCSVLDQMINESNFRAIERDKLTRTGFDWLGNLFADGNNGSIKVADCTQTVDFVSLFLAYFLHPFTGWPKQDV